MEKLTRLRVQGFRSLRDVDLELGSLSVLIGANGSGKSNLIEFFNLTSHMLSGDFQLYVARRGGGSTILRYGPKTTPTISADFSFEEQELRSTYGFTLAFAEPDRLAFVEERVGSQRLGEPEQPPKRNYSLSRTESVLPKLATGAGAGEPSAIARAILERLRGLQTYHFHDTSETAPIRNKQDVGNSRELSTHGGNLPAFLYMLQIGYPQHYERIVSTVRLAVPYLKDFDLAPDAPNSAYISLRWRDRNPDYGFGPHQLSDGSLRVIALITALMQPDDLLPTVVVIDEPELGLHPSAIGLIGSLIKAASTKRQVIVATQSPRLLAEFAPEDVVVVEREEDERGYGHSSFRRLSAQDLGDWMKDFDLGTLYEMNVTGGGPE